MDPILPNKICTRCKQSYPATNEYFWTNKAAPDGLYSLCKPCKYKYRIQYRRKVKSANRELIDQAKNVPCADCGESYPPCVMDFDHIKGEKLINISQMLAWSQPQILKEIAKCEVVCSNCHRLRTWHKSVD